MSAYTYLGMDLGSLLDNFEKKVVG
jgi:hypothetical protein